MIILRNWIGGLGFRIILGFWVLVLGLRNILLSCWIKKYVKVDTKFLFLVFEMGFHFGFEICEMGLRMIGRYVI